MSKPDVEKVHDELYRIYHRGHIFDVVHMADGWQVSHAGLHNASPLYTSSTFEDVTAWLQAQATIPS